MSKVRRASPSLKSTTSTSGTLGISPQQLQSMAQSTELFEVTITLQEMQELMEMVTTRGRKVRAAVMGVKMDEATLRLAPQRLYEGFSRLGPTLTSIACHL